MERSIPARAGETATGSRGRRASTVHPRACGGNFNALAAAQTTTGPSPRVRGKPVNDRAGALLRRSIPRVRGKPPFDPLAIMEQRSIPARAGETVRRTAPECPHRSIPARAGETRSIWTIRGMGRVHPRACGGNSVTAGQAGLGEGPSPRVRGKPAVALPLPHFQRSIPRVRGKRAILHRPPVQRRSIPARAGETTRWVDSQPHATVHPRACGGNLDVARRAAGSGGPSPRVRGKLQELTPSQLRVRSIPARAGET